MPGSPSSEGGNRVEAESSLYRSLARVRIEVGLRVQEALVKGEKDVEAHQEFAALRPRIEAQRRLLHQAMVDLEKSETELGAAYDAAFGSPTESDE